MNDVLNDALSNLEHDNYGLDYQGYKDRQADIALIRAALAAQPAINGYTCTVPDDCETLHWRGQILSMNELASMAQPAVGEEIHVHIEGQDVLTLPLASSGIDDPRFVVHVPAQPAASTEYSQFLTDVMTAAGLVSHGKQCKALGERLGAGAMKYRLQGPAASAEHATCNIQLATQAPAANGDALLDALRQIAAWPDGGNRYGQANIKRFAKDVIDAAIAAQAKQGEQANG